MRSSCATFAVNRSSRACAAESAAIFASSASAISLNAAAQAPNSSAAPTGSLVSRRPAAISLAASLALATGPSVRRASTRPTSAATSSTPSQAAARVLRSWARLRWMLCSEKNRYS